jgi:hypothetical protein
MLVSHRKRFIYTKTEKTAGTSVELYFEPYCMPEGEWKFSGSRDQYIGKTGIVGARGKSVRKAQFYNHMSAQAIKDKIGDECWNEYYKFTVIRNPFDKIVSYFHHLDSLFHNSSFIDLPIRRKIHRVIWAFQAPRSDSAIERFRRWVKWEGFLDSHSGGLYPGFVNDRDKYTINDQICVDFFIRFENLEEDIQHVCSHLAIPYDPSRIPRLKAGNRHRALTYVDYYDEATARIIASRYRREIEEFGYRLLG